MVLVIDNYDSFTYNLVQYLGIIGAGVQVERNDAITLDEIAVLKPQAIIISPGPCTPKEAGISVGLVKRFTREIPILGVCLGHQSIGDAFGGNIVTDLAAEVALGPIHDFNFDAAILFSDLLFPLEAMGMGLRYDPGPKLEFHLRTMADVERLSGGRARAAHMQFQADAVTLTRQRLRADKGLIGFVGGPFTLYVYAAAGSHERAQEALAGLDNGIYAAFNEKLLDLLAHNMALQSKAGAECVALFDTAAGEIDAATYGRHVVPVLADVLARFRKLDATTPVTYYSRGTGPAWWDQLKDLPFQCLGVDWRHDITDVLRNYSDRWCIQGNVDPEWLHLPLAELETRLREYFGRVKALPASLRRGWVCGLGHGVLQRTPEANVRRFVTLQREIFG